MDAPEISLILREKQKDDLDQRPTRILRHPKLD